MYDKGRTVENEKKNRKKKTVIQEVFWDDEFLSRV